MAKMLGDLNNCVGGDPAGNAADQNVEFLILEGIDGFFDIFFLIIIGDGIDL
jgi:hypothetical protein